MKIKSNWSGSTTTSELVRKQITTRWGEDEAKKYDPESNCLTYKNWLKYGYKVKRGEKAIKSFIVIEEQDKEKKMISRHPVNINLFYVKQVEKIEEVA